MLHCLNDVAAPATSPATLEHAVASLEKGLATLGQALFDRDPLHIESASDGLQRALSVALAEFQKAARDGHVPPELRRRLMRAGGDIAAQRDALSRAAASLDRAIDVLLPDSRPLPVYEARLGASRATHASMRV